MMFQTTLLASGEAELRMARIVVDFRSEQHGWRIAHFTTRSLLKMPLNEQTALAMAAALSE